MERANGFSENDELRLEIGPWGDLWLRSTPSLQVSLLSIGLFHHDAEHAPVGIRVDNVVVSTERIGCPGL